MCAVLRSLLIGGPSRRSASAGALLLFLLAASARSEIVISEGDWDSFLEAGAAPGSQVPGPVVTDDGLTALWMPRAGGVGGGNTDKFIIYMVRVEQLPAGVTRFPVQVLSRQVGDNSNGMTIRNLSIDPDPSPATQRSFISILMNDGGAGGPALARDDRDPGANVDPAGTIGRSGTSVTNPLLCTDPNVDPVCVPPDLTTTVNATMPLKLGLNLLKIDPADPRDLPAYDPDTGWQAFSITFGPDEPELKGDVTLPPLLVRRDVQDTFTAPASIEVLIDLEADAGASFNAVEVREVVPRGFTPSEPSDGGTVEQSQPGPGRQTVVWKLANVSGARTLAYKLAVPNPYPNSAYGKSAVTADGDLFPIFGDRQLTGGSDGWVSQALVITLRQPGAACGDTDNPGVAAIRRDFLTDGDALSEVTVVPKAGESVAPDFNGASPSPGPTAPTSTTWTPKTAPAGWFDLNTCEQCMSYVAFYAENDTGGTLRVTIGSASDDSQQILIDGKEVWINNVARGAAAARVQDRTPPLDLPAGKHLVMQKVFEGCGGFDSAIRFEDEDQNPLLLKLSLDPTGYQVGTAFVLRDIPDTLDVGECGAITLKLRVREATEGATVEENVPEGWAIAAVSDGGTLLGQRIVWNLAGRLQSRDLSYQVCVPESAIDSCFQGTAVLGGNRTSILGDLCFARGIMNPAGFIKHWLVLGPFDTLGLWPGDLGSPNNNVEGTSATPEGGDLRLDYLSDGKLTEANIRPFDGMRIAPAWKGDGVSGSKALDFEPLARECAPASPTWERFVAQGGTFDNNAYFGADVNSHTTYAACYLTNTTPAPIEAVVAFHSDDAFIAFLDGKEIGAYEPAPCSAAACGRGFGGEDTVANTFPVTIPVGESFLLTRVHDGFGGSGHRLRFQDAAGNPLLPPALTVRLLSKASPPAAYVRRSIESASYRLPETPRVMLRIEASGAHDLAIREVLPPGWSAGDITQGGRLEAGAVQWTLGGVSGTRELTYRLAAGDCPGGGAYCGNGIDGSQYTVDGTSPHALNGDSSIRRDTRGTDPLGQWDARDLAGSGGGTQRVGDHAADVSGRGSGVRGGKDEFRFISLPRTGDFELSARIECLDDPGGAGQAGLMVRDTFDAFAANAFFFLASTPPPGGGAGTLRGGFRRLTKPNQPSSVITITDRDVLSLPVWLKLKREGAKVSFQRSADGNAFTEVAFREIGTGLQQLNLRDEALVGLAVSGGGSGATLAAFREVSGPAFTEVAAVPEPPAGLVATFVGFGTVRLSWSAPASGPAPDGYRVLRSAAPGGPYAQIAEVPAVETIYEDKGVACGARFCYVVRSKRGAEESRNSNEACAQAPVPAVTFRRGDVNSDGKIDVTDPVKLLGFLFLGQGKPECLDAADTDDSGLADISDAVSNLGYQFLGAGPPAAPGPTDCGPDPGAEVPDLGCDVGCDSGC